MTSPTPTSERGVEILTWSGCPSHEDALAQLERVLTVIGRPDVPVSSRWIETDEAAAAERFVGSPSYRVDDEEVLEAGDGELYALTCRVYRRRDGRFSPLPDDEDLRDALAAALR